MWKFLVYLVLALALCRADEEACGEGRPRVMRGATGQFNSPNFPENYPPNSNCHWHIIGDDEEESMGVSMEEIIVETCIDCACDAVDVYDGNSTDAPLLGSLCEAGGQPVVGSSNEIYVVFRSDASIEFMGFSARFAASERACSVSRPREITATDGNFTSPNYPSNYDNNLDCSWLVKGEGQQVRVLFFDFELEGGDGCPFDSVSVYDVNDDGDDESLLGTYCGSDFPLPHVSTRGNIRVDFTTDGSITFRGFAIRHTRGGTIDEIACGPERPRHFFGDIGAFDSPNFPDAYPDLSDCHWHLEGNTEEESERLGLVFLDLDFGPNCTDCSCDSVTVFDGNSTEAEIIDTICSQDDLPFVATGHDLYVQFRSDDGTNPAGQGFSAVWAVIRQSDIACSEFKPANETGVTGSFASPNYPSDYGNDLDCSWIVQGFGSEVGITFADFELEGGDCSYDYVEVFDSNEDGSIGENLGRWCGTNTPPAINSTRGNLRVSFVTDGSITNRGFFVNYERHVDLYQLP